MTEIVRGIDATGALDHACCANDNVNNLYTAVAIAFPVSLRAQSDCLRACCRPPSLKFTDFTYIFHRSCFTPADAKRSLRISFSRASAKSATCASGVLARSPPGSPERVLGGPAASGSMRTSRVHALMTCSETCPRGHVTRNSHRSADCMGSMIQREF
jgi:hypothetical protein